jgi:hypothetical protein
MANFGHGRGRGRSDTGTEKPGEGLGDNVVPFRPRRSDPIALDPSSAELRATLDRIFAEALSEEPRVTIAPRPHHPSQLWDPDTAPWVAVLDELLLKMVTSGAEVERWVFSRLGIDRRSAVRRNGSLAVQASQHALLTTSLAFRELMSRSGTITRDDKDLLVIDVRWGGRLRRWHVVLPDGCDPVVPRFPLTVAFWPLPEETAQHS